MKGKLLVWLFTPRLVTVTPIDAISLTLSILSLGVSTAVYFVTWGS